MTTNNMMDVWDQALTRLTDGAKQTSAMPGVNTAFARIVGPAFGIGKWTTCPRCRGECYVNDRVCGYCAGTGQAYVDPDGVTHAHHE